MTTRGEITQYLNSLLSPELFDDATFNGLQIEGKENIRKAGFCVDISEEILKTAVERNCDMLVVHHGLIWGGVNRLDGAMKRRFELILKNDINLYVSHLPLDKHPEIGNNVSIIKELGAVREEEFDEVAYIARFEKPLSYGDFLELVRKRISLSIRTMDFGSKTVDRFVVSSGGFSPRKLDRAISAGVGTILTGEGGMESLFYYQAMENSINVVFAGHYATEVFGVRNLETMVKERFDIYTEFIDMPTGW